MYICNVPPGLCLFPSPGEGAVGEAVPSLLPTTPFARLADMADQLYTETEQVLGPGSTWINAPPPSFTSLDSSSNSTAPHSPVLFRAFKRTFRGAAKHDSYVWLEIVSPALLKSLKAVFPTLATLYEAIPGVRGFSSRAVALLTLPVVQQIDARAVYVQREALRAAAQHTSLDSLLAYVAGYFAYV